MGKVLYEVRYEFDFHAFIPIIMLIGIPLILIMWKKGGETVSKGMKVFFGVIWSIVLVVAVLSGKDHIDMYNAIIGGYKSGNYQIVEGYVENFHPMPSEGHDSESFDINGVHFSYSDYSIMFGYHNAKSKGGVITGDGQYLKIGYIHYDTKYDTYGNVIVYIEELPPGN